MNRTLENKLVFTIMKLRHAWYTFISDIIWLELRIKNYHTWMLDSVLKFWFSLEASRSFCFSLKCLSSNFISSSKRFSLNFLVSSSSFWLASITEERWLTDLSFKFLNLFWSNSSQQPNNQFKFNSCQCLSNKTFCHKLYL